MKREEKGDSEKAKERNHKRNKEKQRRTEGKKAEKDNIKEKKI